MAQRVVHEAYLDGINLKFVHPHFKNSLVCSKHVLPKLLSLLQRSRTVKRFRTITIVFIMPPDFKKGLKQAVAAKIDGPTRGGFIKRSEINEGKNKVYIDEGATLTHIVKKESRKTHEELLGIVKENNIRTFLP